MADNSSGCGGLITLGLIALGIYSCSNHRSENKVAEQQAVIAGDVPTPSTFDSVVATANPVRADFDEEQAREAAQTVLSGDTYEATQGSSDCTDDCGGHDAGWQWAKDGNDCGSGDSASFDAGCRAFQEATDERVEEARQRYSDGESTFERE